MQLGSGRTAKVPIHVGEVLSRRECNGVRTKAMVLRLESSLTKSPISFIVDSADKEALPVAREELKLLLERASLEGIPLLVLGNKSDLPDHLSVDELIDAMELKTITHREVSCYGISAKEETNLDAVLQWLIARAKR